MPSDLLKLQLQERGGEVEPESKVDAKGNSCLRVNVNLNPKLEQNFSLPNALTNQNSDILQTSI